MVPGWEAEQLLSQRASSDRWPITAVVQERDSSSHLFSQSSQPIGGLCQVDWLAKPRPLQVVSVGENKQSVTTPLWTEELLNTQNTQNHQKDHVCLCVCVCVCVPPHPPPGVCCCVSGPSSQQAPGRARHRGRAHVHYVGGASQGACRLPSASGQTPPPVSWNNPGKSVWAPDSPSSRSVQKCSYLFGIPLHLSNIYNKLIELTSTRQDVNIG